jgi:hypothetical protein
MAARVFAGRMEIELDYIVVMRWSYLLVNQVQLPTGGDLAAM